MKCMRVTLEKENTEPELVIFCKQTKPQVEGLDLETNIVTKPSTYSLFCLQSVLRPDGNSARLWSFRASTWPLLAS